MELNFRCRIVLAGTFAMGLAGVAGFRQPGDHRHCTGVRLYRGARPAWLPMHFDLVQAEAFKWSFQAEDTDQQWSLTIFNIQTL